MAGFLDMRGKVISKMVRPGQSDLLEVALYYGPAPWQPTGAELKILASALNNALGREEDTVPLGYEFALRFERVTDSSTPTVKVDPVPSVPSAFEDQWLASADRPATRECPACKGAGRFKVGEPLASCDGPQFEDCSMCGGTGKVPA